MTLCHLLHFNFCNAFLLILKFKFMNFSCSFILVCVIPSFMWSIVTTFAIFIDLCHLFALCCIDLPLTKYYFSKFLLQQQRSAWVEMTLIAIFKAYLVFFNLFFVMSFYLLFSFLSVSCFPFVVYCIYL